VDVRAPPSGGQHLHLRRLRSDVALAAGQRITRGGGGAGVKHAGAEAGALKGCATGAGPRSASLLAVQLFQHAYVNVTSADDNAPEVCAQSRVLDEIVPQTVLDRVEGDAALGASAVRVLGRAG